jgi:hypothetical protein
MPPNPQTSTPGNIRRYIRLLRLWKRVVQRVRPYQLPTQTLILIVGAARSGTSLMVRIFERDLRTSVFSEGNEAVTDKAPRGKRPLKPLPVLQTVVGRAPTSLVVMKPLADMHRLPTLLKAFAGAKSVWMVRHYKDVVRSNLAKWGQTNGIRNLREFVENPAGSWQPDMVPDRVCQAALALYAENMNPHDAAALVWLIRNGLFFGLHLAQNANVTICRYEQLIRAPVSEMQRLYGFVGHAFPGEHIVAEIRPAALRRDGGIVLSKTVEGLCEEMLAELDRLACMGEATGRVRPPRGTS